MNFISKAVIKICTFGLATLVGVGLSGIMYTLALQTLQSTFLLGALVATLVPITLFLMTHLYQRGVVVPIRQLSMMDKDNIDNSQATLVYQISSKRKITEKVPFFSAIITAFSAIIIIPSDIIKSMDSTSNIIAFDALFICMLISMLAITSFHALKMAIASLKYNLQLQ